MSVIILGGGGREHALAWSLSSSGVPIVVSPGNGGVSTIPNTTTSPYTGVEGAVRLCKGARLVVVGPEAPLADGICDALAKEGIPCFGPTAAAARLETSKAWSKDFMVRAGIPTAAHASFTSLAQAEAYIKAAPHRVVVKASGLCAGKGVVVARDTQEALEAVRGMLGGSFGEAGKEVVIEEFLEGVEASVLAVCDGTSVFPFPAAQDHKRAWEFDEGPNTGGMGCYAPAPIVDSAMMAEVVSRVLNPVVSHMRSEGNPFVGVIFAGLMIHPTTRRLSVLEFNARFGDPEAQTVLPLLQSPPLLDILSAAAGGVLGPLIPTIRFKQGVASASVVAVAGGYPGEFSKGDPISIRASSGGGGGGAAAAAAAPLTPTSTSGSILFHGGTAAASATATAGTAPPPPPGFVPLGVVSAGGRVLIATSLAPSRAAALAASYSTLEGVTFPGMYYRKDIGGLGWRVRPGGEPLRVGILGSTRGSSLEGVFGACEKGDLTGCVFPCIVTNVAGAGILEKAGRAGAIGAGGGATPAATYVIPSKGIPSEVYEAAITKAFTTHACDIILCCGFMRILSPTFTARWRHRVINVHPSLLPAHAGLMDLGVHSAVLSAGERVTGCTVHLVTETVDAGFTLVQRSCAVDPAVDTPEALKARVQGLEGEALCAALGLFTEDGGLDVLGGLRRAGVVVGEGGGGWASLPLPKDRIRTLPAHATTTAAAGGHTGRLTYAAAGVDIDAGDSLVDRIKPLARSTARPGADCDLGGFGGLFDLKAAGYKDPLIVSGTDGVGTKLKIAMAAGVHNTVGIDLVAMSVNDLVVQGAQPLVFLDYFATGKLMVEQAAAVIEGVAEGCRQAGCALVGGETAEMPSMYHDGDYDLAGFSWGAVERDRVLPLLSAQSPGNVILGIPSSGVHSNGFSLVRRICSTYGVSLDAPPPYPSSSPRLVDSLLTPTRIYIKGLAPALALNRVGDGTPAVLACAHITGGGLPDNVHRGLADGLGARIDATAWPMPPVFKWLANVGGGVEPMEMARTFNCGIGMVVVCREEDVGSVSAAIVAGGESVYRIGVVVEHKGGEDTPRVVLDNINKAFL